MDLLCDSSLLPGMCVVFGAAGTQVYYWPVCEDFVVDVWGKAGLEWNSKSGNGESNPLECSFVRKIRIKSNSNLLRPVWIACRLRKRHPKYRPMTKHCNKSDEAIMCAVPLRRAFESQYICVAGFSALVHFLSWEKRLKRHTEMRSFNSEHKMRSLIQQITCV